MTKPNTQKDFRDIIAPFIHSTSIAAQYCGFYEMCALIKAADVSLLHTYNRKYEYIIQQCQCALLLSDNIMH